MRVRVRFGIPNPNPNQRLLMRLSAFLESLRRTRFMSAEAHPASMVARAGGKEHGSPNPSPNPNPNLPLTITLL